MDSASEVFSKCENAENGIALLIPELVLSVVLATVLELEVAADSAPAGGTSVAAAGVYNADVVSAFDPAADDPDDENEAAAPAPVALADALDWMYRCFSMSGSC